MSGNSTSDMIGKSPDRRKLIAVVYADMVGYSRLIGLDDIGTLERLRRLRTELIDPAIDEHGGRIVQTGGDSMLMVFDSIEGAVRCAVKVQKQVPTLDGDQPPDRAIRFRVGINIGDAIADGTDLHGDAVNVAARIQTECPPGGICVTRAVRDHVRGRFDIVFEALGPLTLKNIADPVVAFVVRLETSGTMPKPAEQSLVQTTPKALPLPDKPSLAVLPFQNMSGDPEQEYFADGMVEEITTALARIRWLFVTARNSSFTYKGRPIDVKQVGRELGVRYVLEGSVRKAAGRIRITAQLIEAETGAHLWADRFDGSLEDIFDLQDKIAIRVAGIIEPTLQAAEIHRSVERSTMDLTAYDLYLRAWALAFSWEKEGTLQSLELLKRAIERDPHYGPALAQAAARYYELHVNGWTAEPEATRRNGIDLARRALHVSGDDPNVLSTAGFTLAYFGEELDAAIGLIDRALELNPSDARAWPKGGWLRLWAGQTVEAIHHFETSLRLNPREQRANAFMAIGVAKFFDRQFEEAENHAASIAAREAELGADFPISCLLLRTHGTAQGSPGYYRTAEHSHGRGGAQRSSLAQPRTPRALSIWSATCNSG